MHAKDVQEYLYDFVVTNGGEIDRVVETREHWREQWEHHYDLRPVVGGVTFYVETHDSLTPTQTIPTIRSF